MEILIMSRIYKNNLNHKTARCKRLNKPVDDISRFWSYVDIKGEDECWEWKGVLDIGGYGHFSLNGKHIPAHRLSYQLYYGDIPEGKQINHTCHNRKCCNPFHTYAGTHKDNMDDMVRMNRQANGESQGMAKLTEKQVVEIKENRNNLSQRKLGELYGVKHNTIGNILRNRTWKHIPCYKGINSAKKEVELKA
jgi:hypothetical protein